MSRQGRIPSAKDVFARLHASDFRISANVIPGQTPADRACGELRPVRSLRGVSLRYTPSWLAHGFALREDLPPQAFLAHWQPVLHATRARPEAKGLIRWAIDVDPLSV